MVVSTCFNPLTSDSPSKAFLRTEKSMTLQLFQLLAETADWPSRGVEVPASNSISAPLTRALQITSGLRCSLLKFLHFLPEGLKLLRCIPRAKASSWGNAPPSLPRAPGQGRRLHLEGCGCHSALRRSSFPVSRCFQEFFKNLRKSCVWYSVRVKGAREIRDASANGDDWEVLPVCLLLELY